MRLLADLHSGTGKTDARNAYVIDDAARTHLLHSIDPAASVRVELPMVLTTTLPRTPPASPIGFTDCSPPSVPACGTRPS
ncbi:hypothetical protein [Streptomyces sp. NPDC059788]|uniref:hypothetical protein n=1 Tax=Streptomyces sp. NPDC059788 TaxID=3346948 RepID=UPI003646B89B